ncbi:cytoplasmic protein [Piscinibacter defluvii]|uniref:cytoplasmic protein n=1 Tax=Piscinibacter defluvii TaxID=1796922 RepID=UPI000FDE26A3|nr:cytoplasmic protein [Piscinibacter defluvii]
MNPLLAAHRHTWDNRTEIEASTLCGCCSCMEVFPAQEIVAWSGLDTSSFDNLDTASGATALCPRCGSESLIGDKAGFSLTPEFLGRMNQAWFQKTIIRKPVAKKP